MSAKLPCTINFYVQDWFQALFANNPPYTTHSEVCNYISSLSHFQTFKTLPCKGKENSQPMAVCDFSPFGSQYYTED